MSGGGPLLLADISGSESSGSFDELFASELLKKLQGAPDSGGDAFDSNYSR